MHWQLQLSVLGNGVAWMRPSVGWLVFGRLRRMKSVPCRVKPLQMRLNMLPDGQVSVCCWTWPKLAGLMLSDCTKLLCTLVMQLLTIVRLIPVHEVTCARCG